MNDKRNNGRVYNPANRYLAKDYKPILPEYETTPKFDFLKMLLIYGRQSTKNQIASHKFSKEMQTVSLRQGSIEVQSNVTV